jgi:type II secretory pathway pseudopilin PulG
MMILLTLVTASLGVYQANARDEERKTDVTTIAQQLETYYSAFGGGTYPYTTLVNTEAKVKTALPDLDVRALRDPSTATTNTMSFTVASNTSVPTLASLNSGKTYIYQPIDGNNALCTTVAQECRKFNLYYTLETDLTIKTITSKHQ